MDTTGRAVLYVRPRSTKSRAEEQLALIAACVQGQRAAWQAVWGTDPFERLRPLVQDVPPLHLAYNPHVSALIGLIPWHPMQSLAVPLGGLSFHGPAAHENLGITNPRGAEDRDRRQRLLHPASESGKL